MKFIRQVIISLYPVEKFENSVCDVSGHVCGWGGIAVVRIARRHDGVCLANDANAPATTLWRSRVLLAVLAAGGAVLPAAGEATGDSVSAQPRHGQCRTAAM